MSIVNDGEGRHRRETHKMSLLFHVTPTPPQLTTLPHRVQRVGCALFCYSVTYTHNRQLLGYLLCSSNTKHHKLSPSCQSKDAPNSQLNKFISGSFVTPFRSRMECGCLCRVTDRMADEELADVLFLAKPETPHPIKRPILTSYSIRLVEVCSWRGSNPSSPTRNMIRGALYN